MKKVLSLIVLAIISITSFCQSTTPRFGITKNQDNTGRVLTYSYITYQDATAADTLNVSPNAWTTIYNITLKDSLTLRNVNVSTSNAGDNIEIICTAPSGTPFIKFAGSNWISAGTATLSTRLRAVIRFVFDGSKWVEVGRYAQ